MWYHECRLCPRNCGVDRVKQAGACKIKIEETEEGVKIPVARAALHFWEEPCISGEEGSGTVFFTGCSLGCIFCQNHEISGGESGLYITTERLSDIFLELQDKGANNINLVTAGHVLPIVIDALKQAKEKGLTLPVLYNTGSYETVEAIKSLSGLVDIYLPDLKYYSEMLSERYSHAKDYYGTAVKAIEEMYRQTGPCVFDERGIIKRGTIVRHLVMPGCVSDSRRVIRYLYDTYGDNIYISIMNQYTPLPHVKDIPLLSRRVKKSEYDQVVDYAVEIGVENGFIQEGAAASESFIPPFNHEGVL